MMLTPKGRILRLVPEDRIVAYEMELLPSTLHLSQVSDIIF